MVPRVTLSPARAALCRGGASAGRGVATTAPASAPAVGMFGDRLRAGIEACKPQAAAYGECVKKNLSEDLKQDTCEAEFAALRACYDEFRKRQRKGA